MLPLPLSSDVLLLGSCHGFGYFINGFTAERMLLVPF
jgi:hypothetical protein